MNDRLRMLQRQPRRITITINYHLHEALLKRCEEEGRSLSNLGAFLLEDGLHHSVRLPVAAAPIQRDPMAIAQLRPMDRTMRCVGFQQGR